MSIVKNNITKFINGDLDIGNGYLGESVTITTSANVDSNTLGEYFTNYTIQTESTINFILPTAVNVGWGASINLITNTGTGNINILNGATQIARLNGNTGRQTVTVNVLLINSTTYIPMYSLPLYGDRQVAVATANGILARSSILASFYSYCDIAAGVPIDANTTIDIPLRWINPNGQYLDSLYYSIVSNTRITHLQAGTYKYCGLIAIANAGGATQTNLNIRPRLNATTFPGSFSVVPSTILLFTNGVYLFNGTFSLSAGDYMEIVVSKSIVSGGTNPLSLNNTVMSIRLIGQN